MTRVRSTPILRECKAEAKRLMAALRADDAQRARQAAERLRRIPSYAERSTDEILLSRDEVQLKHAQWTVALEQGYPDWKALKDAADVAWYPRGSAYLNAWFARYEEARVCLDQHGGYLLTHCGKYFVCDAGYIASLGLDPKDPRWQAIGRDIARPKDARAGRELIGLAETEAKRPRESAATSARRGWRN